MKGRNKRALLVSIALFLIFTTASWYVNYGEEKIDIVEDKIWLSHSEAKEVAMYYNPNEEYYYDVRYTKLTKRTLVPFVYEVDTLTKVHKSLYGRRRD